MVNIGINGFGRIGKCCFLQLINDTNVKVKCINAVNLTISDIEDYLIYDSIHTNYNKSFTFKILNDNVFQVNHHIVTLVSDRNPKNIPWRHYNCDIVIEATGVYLTSEKCKLHDVDNVVITSPAKDNTPTYIYGVNHDNYKGENIISASSCTTNCLAPMLNILHNNYEIQECVFTTIHATTASQYTIDTANSKLRTHRSILNNIIPHTTGASSSILSVLPSLNGKINGTSVRVPVSNCSLLDVNIELKTNINLNDISELIKSNAYYKSIYDISCKKLVSTDFITTITPCILDTNASIDMGNGKFKLILWYDNEWSYSTQIIRLVKEVYNYKKNKFIQNTKICNKYYIENVNVENKGIVCRFDYNVPINNKGEIIDDFRIVSTISTIQYLMSQNPKYIILVSHFGRPTKYDPKQSLQFLVPVLEKYLGREILFLSEGVSENTLNVINNSNSFKIYLLENIRFHNEETNYELMNEEQMSNNEIIKIYSNLGDIYLCDAFGCMHRKHMSIHLMSKLNNFCYGMLVKKEIENVMKLINKKSKKLAIIGGNKIKDKLPIIDLMKNIENTKIFVCGGLASQYKSSHDSSNVYVMSDGYGNKTLIGEPIYIPNIINSDLNIYDIGIESAKQLYDLIDESDIIFCNGSLGVIENEYYKVGSYNLINYLKTKLNKTIIIGGGDTSTLVENKQGNIYVSTGGGALLEFLQNVLNDKNYSVGLDIFL